MKLKKIDCVVVNYNDAETVIQLVSRIREYQCFDQIVVVDNASTDDSWQRLKSVQDHKVMVIRGDRNGGYGYGNNLGVRYAVQVNEATHVVIANPDVEFSPKTVLAMARMFDSHPDAGVVSAVMEDERYGGMGYGWPLRGFVGELLSMGPVSMRLFRRFLNYPKSYFEGKKAVWVEAVHGSMLMVDAAAFMECGGYDENIFLYQEEAVLGQRMRTSGYGTILLLTESYVHRHGASIGKSLGDEIRRQKLRHDSVMYYMEHYLYINPVQEAMARLWFQAILMEIRIAKIVPAVRGRVS